MQINKISVQISKYQSFTSTPTNLVKQNTTLNTAQNQTTNTNNKHKQIIKYTAIGTGIIALVIGIIKHKSIIEKFKKIFTHKPKLSDNNPTSIVSTESVNFSTAQNSTPEILQKPINNEEVLSEPKASLKFIDFLECEDCKEKQVSGVYDEITEKIYRKYNDKNYEKEILASKIYNLNNVKSPEYKPILHGIDVIGSKVVYIENLKNITEKDYPKLQKNFGTDALLANREILKSAKIDENGNVIRVNLQNTLDSDEKHNPQYFGTIVEEISDFFNKEKNPMNFNVYSSMTREDFINSLKNLSNLDLIHTLKYLENEGISHLESVKYNDLIIQRLTFLYKLRQLAEKTEQGNLKLPEYVKKIYSQTIANNIPYTKDYSMIKDIEHAINKIDDTETKEDLSKLLKTQIKQLTVDKKNPNKLTQYETGELLDKYLYKNHEFTEKELTEIKKTGFDTKYLSTLKEPMSLQEIHKATEFVNINDGKYIDYWKQNPDKLALYINSKCLNDCQLVSFRPETWDMILNIFKETIKNPQKIKDNINAIIQYSGMGSYDRMNGFLRVNSSINETLKTYTKNSQLNEFEKQKLNAVFENIKYIVAERMVLDEFSKRTNTEYLKKELEKIINSLNENCDINELRNLIQNFKNTFNDISKKFNIEEEVNNLKNVSYTAGKTESEIKLIRNETSDIFCDTLINGENLENLIRAGRTDKKAKEKVLTYFNETKPAVNQAGFLSTSIAPYNALAGNIKWNLKLGEKTKYNYLSDIIKIFDKSQDETEAEVLIMPGHKIQVTNAKYENNKLILSGIILPQ